MANKRMFTMKIVDSDAFLDMPLSTQCLYFHLNMRADDDGFVGNPRKVLKIISTDENDLSLLKKDLERLIEKRFLLTFEDGVIVIKHWRMHNTLSKQRYHETQYLDEKNMLKIKQNGAYSMTDGENINDKKLVEMYVEESEETVKENKDEELRKNFDIIYKFYPKHVGKTKGFELYKAWVTKGRMISGRRVKLTNRQIWDAISKYKEQFDNREKDIEFCKQFDTFMNKAILDYLEEDK